MPKKVAKGSSRSGGGAAREFQRRTRIGEMPTDSAAPVALQDGDHVVITAAPTNGSSAINGATNGTPVNVAPRPNSSTGVSANTRFRGTVSPSAAPRAGGVTRSAAPLYGGPLGARGRAANAASLSVEDEVSYIKGDIRRLIILAVICFALLIILGFLLTR